MLAELWVGIAVTSAQAQVLEEQSRQLDHERDQIMLEASRRDAELARREVDRLRLQALAQQEEAERLAVAAEANRQAGEQAAADALAATAEAAQARKLADAREHEAQLAREEARLASGTGGDAEVSLPTSRIVAGKTVYTLSSRAFPSGSAHLTDSARASLRRLAASLPAHAKLRIEGHTDSQGKVEANLVLSQHRAEAVRQALVEAGLEPSGLKAVGRGQADPIGDNGSAEGRARNRRVDLTVQ
jgi:outer membrane protein OmpA-like peptidoglycan-associated protein